MRSRACRAAGLVGTIHNKKRRFLSRLFLLYGNWEEYLFFFEKMTVESDNGCGGVDLRFSFGRKGCEIKIIDIFGSYDQILTVKFRGRFTL